MLRWLSLSLWCGLLYVGFFASPPIRPEIGPWLVDLMTGQWSKEEPMVVMVFHLLGVWPMVWAIALRRHLVGRPLPAWPFVAGSCALGGYGLFPWLFVLAHPRQPVDGRLSRSFGHVVLLSGVTIYGLGMIAFGLWAGDIDTFLQIFRTEGFVHIMSFDFAAIYLAFIAWAYAEDRASGHRRWVITAVPVVGALAWLWLGRPKT